MRLVVLILVPLLGALTASGRWSARQGVGWLLGAAGIHLGLVASLWVRPAGAALSGWLAADPLGLVVLSLVYMLIDGHNFFRYVLRFVPRVSDSARRARARYRHHPRRRVGPLPTNHIPRLAPRQQAVLPQEDPCEPLYRNSYSECPKKAW